MVCGALIKAFGEGAEFYACFAERVCMARVVADNIVNFNGADMKWFTVIKVRNNCSEFVKMSATKSFHGQGTNLF